MNVVWEHKLAGKFTDYIGISFSDDGRYLAIQRKSGPLILFDEKGDVLWEKELPCDTCNVLTGSSESFMMLSHFEGSQTKICKYGMKGEILGSFFVDGGGPLYWYSDSKLEGDGTELRYSDGRVGPPMLLFQSSDDGSLINVIYLDPAYLQAIDWGKVYDNNGARIFAEMEKKGIQIIAISRSNNYFIGYKCDTKEFFLVSRDGEIKWKRKTPEVWRCVFSGNERYILGTTPPCSITYLIEDLKVFLYDINGKRLWEKHILFDYEDDYAYKRYLIDDEGRYVILRAWESETKAYSDWNSLSILCINRAGDILWKTPSGHYRNCFISADGSSVFAVACDDPTGNYSVLKFSNIDLKQ